MTLLLQDTLVISPKTKQQVEKNTAAIAELQEKSAIAYHFKGSKPTFNDLPTTGNEVGDVWDVQDTGANYGWTGTEWDELGPIADLEPYLTKEEAAAIYSTKTETDAQLDEKADKATTYTKEETDTLLDAKADKTEVYRSLSEEQETVLLSTGKYNGETVLTGDIFTSESGVFKSYSESPVPASWKYRGDWVYADLAAYGNGIWVVFSTMGNRYSYDGMTFSLFSYSGSVDDGCGLTFGNGKFLLVRKDGVVSYSEDGKNWIDVNDTGLPTTLGSVTAGFGNGRFVVVSRSSTARYTTYYSDDGISWTPVTHEITVGGSKILYGNGVFFLSSEYYANAHYFYSTDGIHWNASNLQGTNLVAYGNGKFVAVYYSGESRNLVRVSTDGITWTNVDRIAFRTNAGILTFCDGLFIGENSYETFISTDGENWTITDGGVSSSNSPTYAVSETTVLIFAPGGALYAYEPNSVDRTLTPLSYTKEEVDALIPEPVDAYTKTETDELLSEKANKSEVYRSLSGEQLNILTNTGEYNGDLVPDGDIFVSDSGSVVQYHVEPNPEVSFQSQEVSVLPNDGVWGGCFSPSGRCVLVTQEGGAYSDDLYTWYAASPTWNNTTAVSNVIYVNGRFLCLIGGTLKASEDGSTWSNVTSSLPNGSNFKLVYFNNTLYIFNGNSIASTYYTSTGDFTAFQSSSLPVSDAFRAHTITSTGRLILMGRNGYVIYTDDGSTWTSLGVITYRNAVASGYVAGVGERLVAVGDTNYQFNTRPSYSDDNGLTWNLVPSGAMPSAEWTGVAYGNGMFVATSLGIRSPRYAAISYDGISWTELTLNNVLISRAYVAYSESDKVFVEFGAYSRTINVYDTDSKLRTLTTLSYSKEEVGTLLSQCVQVIEQNLTDEQKTQARENIEAAPTPIISSTDPTEDTPKRTGQIYVNSTKGNAYIYKNSEQDWTNPTLSENGTPGGSSFAAFDIVSDRFFDAYNAFDGIYGANSGWSAKYALPGEGFWALGWYNPNPIKIEKFVVYNRFYQGAYSSGIKDFVLQGSDDGVDYVDIQSYRSTEVAANRTFVVDNPVNYYKYHRLKITSYNSGPSDTGPCIEELVLTGVELQGELSWIPLAGNNSVSYTYQSLTDAEKEQARENIGAASISLEASLDEKADKATTLSGYGITDAYTKEQIDAKIGDINAILDKINRTVV